MSLWTNKDHRTILNDAEDLSHAPDASPWTKRFMGCLIPLLILTYSLYSIHRGHITLFGKGNSTTIHGDDLPLLAGAYIAFAAFLHFHCYWSLHDRLWPYAQRLKVISLLTFLPCLLLVIYHQVIG